MHIPLRQNADEQQKRRHYKEVFASIKALLAHENDVVAAMATVACELHHAFDYFHWTGFYRVVAPELLKIGPYQGTHGCIDIPFHRGVCGKAARDKETQLVPDVEKFADHIACSSTTRSEIVVPILSTHGQILGVLDLDSNELAAFDRVDQEELEAICAFIGQRWTRL